MSVEVHAHGSSRVLRIHRPEARNAIDEITANSLVDCALECASDPSVRALILAATPPTFIAGGDLRAFANHLGVEGGHTVSDLGHRLIAALHGTRLPLLAAIEGPAYGGGCELAAACDFRFMSPHASLHWVQGLMGVTTGWGATHRLNALIHATLATQWLLAPAPVTAQEAFAAGFLSLPPDPGGALTQALVMAERIATVSRSVTAAQLALLRAAREPTGPQRQLERELFAACWAEPPHEEAVARFIARSGDRESST
ncbi:MAG: enoyl-CoA hydratase/isomerase family protein [Deltaproteobacteria bacterium]|nr:enoyl-CoA hydratase/isomerase family protein [Deltaproteobacteria bacterium]